MSRYSFDQLEVTTAKGDQGDLQAAYIYLPGHPATKGCVGKTVEAGHGVLLDLDKNGSLIGIEILFPLQLEKL